MNKTSKGVILLDYLIDGKKTKKQIAKKLEISERTVMRLINELSGEFAIGSSDGRNGGYYILPGANLRSGFLTKDEISIVIEALSAYRTSEKEAVENLFLKLKSISNNNIEWMYIDFSKWDSSGNMDKLFDDIKNAIITSSSIEFTYFDMYFRKTLRTVNPYWLVFKESDWYLNAFCLLRNEMRTFKISRMTKINILSSNFIVDEKLKQDRSIFYNTRFPVVDLVLKVRKNFAAKVYDDFDRKYVREYDNNNLVVECSMFKDDKFIPLLLSYGDNAHIISPKNIYEEISSIVNKMYKKYN